MATKVFGFDKSKRILGNHEFRRIFKYGRRLSGPALTLVYRIHHPAQGSDRNPRLGLSVSRKVGKSHDRNLVKRRLREIFRHIQNEFSKNIEIVIIPRKEMCNMSYFEIENSVLDIFFRSKLIKRT